MISTINISLPKKLKEAADALVANGEYASFSDFMRTSARELLARRYQKWIDEADDDIKTGRAVELTSNKEIEAFVNKHME
jgi:Arc/MetJ-type ribon-helix-helix transcriptional regulator